MFEIKVEKKGIVKISGALTASSIDVLYSELEKIFRSGNCTVLDCTEVTDIDVAALQVMFAFKKALLEVNRQIDYVANPVVIEASTLTGLKNLFKAAVDCKH